MKSIIEKFYMGEPICDNIPQSDEYKKVYDKFSNLEDKFTKLLTKEQCEKYQELILLAFGLEAEASTTNFLEGFKYGLSFALEAKPYST